MKIRQTRSTDSSSRALLQDNHARPITYLRLAITDRCNLRCIYCRPEKGVPFVPHEEILSYEELERLTAIFCTLGISKVRITGGEPFARKGCLALLERLKAMEGVRSLHITTNGIEIAPYLDALAELGISSINLSLDTLDRQRFRQITRRDHLDDVLRTMHGIIERRIPLKINSVVLADTRDEEIVSLAALAREAALTVRFIEKMPFSGMARPAKLVNGYLLQRLEGIFPAMEECTQEESSTSRVFSLAGYRGKIGIIQGHSRLFCSTCNKVRIAPEGILKTCLYDNGVLDLKKMLRQGAGDREIHAAIHRSIRKRFLNGYEAEQQARQGSEPSMCRIGG